MTLLRYEVLSAFSTTPTAGNKAAVITLPALSPSITPNDAFTAFPPTASLQAIATQLGCPATAFLLPVSAADERYHIRCFDSVHELDLCGHGTIALSQHLFSQANAPSRLELSTVKHGVIIAEHSSNPFNTNDKRVALTFPEIVGFRDIEKDCEEWLQITKGLEEVVGSDHLPITQLRRTEYYLIAQLDSNFKMTGPLNMSKMRNFENTSVLLTQPAPTESERNGPHMNLRVLHSHGDFIEEDPATGSVQCALIPHYLSGDKSVFHPDAYALKTLSVKQQSEATGEMVVQWLEDEHKVKIFGNAVRVGEGDVELEL